MEFPGVLRKNMWKFQGFVKKEVEFLGFTLKIFIISMARSRFWTLIFPKSVTQFCRISMVKACFLWNFLGRVK